MLGASFNNAVVSAAFRVFGVALIKGTAAIPVIRARRSSAGAGGGQKGHKAPRRVPNREVSKNFGLE